MIDASVWISGIHRKGVPLEAIRAAYTFGKVASYDRIWAEVELGLIKKCKWTDTNAALAIADYRARSVDVQIAGTLEGACRDPKDDMVFECAILAGAQYIVSGDRHLTEVGTFEGVTVLKPRQFLELFYSISL